MSLQSKSWVLTETGRYTATFAELQRLRGDWCIIPGHVWGHFWTLKAYLFTKTYLKLLFPLKNNLFVEKLKFYFFVISDVGLVANVLDHAFIVTRAIIGLPLTVFVFVVPSFLSISLRVDIARRRGIKYRLVHKIGCNLCGQWAARISDVASYYGH